MLAAQLAVAEVANVLAAQSAHVPPAASVLPDKRVAEAATWLPHTVSAAIQFPSVGSQQIRVSTALQMLFALVAQVPLVSALACFQ